MSLPRILSEYLLLNLLMACALLLLLASSWITAKTRARLKAGHQLQIHYFVFCLIFALLVFDRALPRTTLFEPVVKVWSASSIRVLKSSASVSNSGAVSLPLISQENMIATSQLGIALALLFSMAIAIALIRLVLDLRLIEAIRRRSFALRRLAGVSILINDEISIPFSFWYPGNAFVIVPSSLVAKPADLRMAIAHEIQHHRQGDTKWVYPLWVLKALCALNPAVNFWIRWLSEIQEFACDETLVDHGRVDSREYARCLVEVAQTARDQRRDPVCATGFVFLTGRKLLKRRIESMLVSSRKTMGRTARWGLASLIALLLTGTAFAAQGLVHDRRVTMADAQKMVAKASGSSELPVVVNDLVLKELNRYIGTPEGRQYMRDSLRRMETYRPLVENKIKEYGVPKELMAVPLIESGYRNLPQSDQRGWGAGLWMFIGSTARIFGLRVDDVVDERLMPEIETDAAMRLLKADELMFKDWHLSLLAYNMGEKAVREAIRKTGSNDAWVLVRKGFENDPNYLPKVMAAILIMQNPESVE